MAERILVVDDDFDSLKLIKQMLQRQGYEVESTDSGLEAIDLAVNDPPDMVILDVMMPDIDGLEVCRRLRADSRTTAIPVVMFTAKTMVDDKVAGFEAGADDYLAKPIHPAELTSRVKVILQRSQQKRVGVPAEVPAAPQNSGMSIAFIGVKGGVGTTTLASNVAAMLAQQDTTLLADLRPGQGTLGISLGYSRAQSMAAILSRPVDEITAELVESQIATHNSGVKLLLSSIRPQESQINPSMAAIIKFMEIGQSLANFRLYDAGVGLTPVSARVIRDVDHTIVVVEPSRVTLLLAAEILKEIDALDLASNRVSLVIFNRGTSSTQVPWQEVEQTLNQEVSAIISPAPDLAAQAADTGVPLVQFQPNSIVAGQITKLSEELVKRGS